MSKRIVQVSLLLVATIAALAQEKTSCDLSGPHTLFSRRASTIERGDIKSPDGRKVLSVTRVWKPLQSDGSVHFTVKSGGKSYSTHLAGFDAEISWAPDSSAFAVTQTEGGGGVGVRVYIFYVGTDGLRKLAISAPVEKAFNAYLKCEVPALPNTGFVTWLAGAQRVLVAAEVVPVSICGCSGSFKLYELHLPDLRIVKTYDQDLAKKRFADVLGCELRDAEDCKSTSR